MATHWPIAMPSTSSSGTCPKGVLGLSASQSVSELKPDEAGPSHGSPESSQQSAGLCAAQ
jgi:hypothetical protein